MEFVDVKKNEEEGETVYDHREYIINDNNNDYTLEIKLYENIFDFTISLSDNIECNYKTRKSSLDIINKFELDSVKYSNPYLILKKSQDM